MKRVTIDEISGECETVPLDSDFAWWGGTKHTWQQGNYTIHEIRADRGQLAIEVYGPSETTAKHLALGYFNAIIEARQ